MQALKNLAAAIDRQYLERYGKKAVYTAVHKRAVPAELRQHLGAQREKGFDVTGEKLTHEVNHYRRLKRAYQRHGATGVIRYLRSQGFQPDEQLIINGLKGHV